MPLEWVAPSDRFRVDSYVSATQKFSFKKEGKRAREFVPK